MTFCLFCFIFLGQKQSLLKGKIKLRPQKMKFKYEGKEVDIFTYDDDNMTIAFDILEPIVYQDKGKYDDAVKNTKARLSRGVGVGTCYWFLVGEQRGIYDYKSH